MASTTFSGPVQAGTIREGAAANLGQVVLAQSEAISQSTTAAATGIIIPANSMITRISVLVTTAWDAVGLLNVGTSVAATELVINMDVSTAADVVVTSDEVAIVDADAFMTVGTSDVTIWHDSTLGTTVGRGILTVEYIQRATALAAIA